MSQTISETSQDVVTMCTSGPTRSGSLYKVSLCNFYRKNKCINGAKCRFAHGLNELRGGPLAHRSRRSKRRVTTNDNLEAGSAGTNQSDETLYGSSLSGSLSVATTPSDHALTSVDSDCGCATYVLNPSSMTTPSNHSQISASLKGTCPVSPMTQNASPYAVYPHNLTTPTHCIHPSALYSPTVHVDSCPSSHTLLRSTCSADASPLCTPTSPPRHFLWSAMCSSPMNHPLSPQLGVGSTTSAASANMGGQLPPWFLMAAIDLRDGRLYAHAAQPGQAQQQQPTPTPVDTPTHGPFTPGSPSVAYGSCYHASSNAAMNGPPATLQARLSSQPLSPAVASMG
eukprot:Selendium_serpulae@DN6239_c1_g1_i4.p1